MDLRVYKKIRKISKSHPKLFFLTGYLVIFYAVSIVLFTHLKLHYQTNFSKEKLEEILVKPSTFRHNVNDPCKYSIPGNPTTNEKEYIKVILNCSDGKVIRGTLSSQAIKDLTFLGVINEYSRINRFDPKLILDDPKWKCSESSKMVTDKSKQLTLPTDINCTYQPD